MTGHVAIVGGGFSGTMLAVQLLRRGGRVTLIEREPEREPGRGLAFGAADPIHLLNVPAGNMSAWPDDPGHFVRWLEERGVADGAGLFAPRRLFGAYVREQLEAAAAEAPGRFRLERRAAAGLKLRVDGVEVRLADGETAAADAAALAFGNLPPPRSRIFEREGMPQGVYRVDPWAPGVAEGLDPEAPVLVIGTGLTMVDIVLLLEKNGQRGPILALSRRGQVPQAHAPGPPPAGRRQHAPATILSRLTQEVRARGEALGWRRAVDELRPFAQAMWQGATPAERSRFLRHLRPWWDIHRHRIAPEVAARIQALAERGQLRVAAGKLVAAGREGDRVAVDWRPRAGDRAERFAAARIINCTGPEVDLARAPEPLLRDLLAQGAIRAGACGLGLDIDRQMRVLDANGAPHERLAAIGPITRGLFWEIVAVPDIRVQVRDLAERLHKGW